MNTRDTKAQREDFYRRIAPLELAPLWERLKGLGGSATEADVDVYHVYTQVEPLDRMRGP